MPANYKGAPMIFLIGGYDSGAPYGVVYEIRIPTQLKPIEQKKDEFGIIWGGQLEITSRILNGYDPSLMGIVKDELGVSGAKLKGLEKRFAELGIRIPYQFLPLQDCVDLSIFLVRATASLQSWQLDMRGVGGAIDVATITRPEGFKYVQQKSIEGEG